MLNLETRLFIAGEYCKGNGDSFLLINPSTDEELCHVHSANKDDIDRAVSAASAAQPVRPSAFPSFPPPSSS
jgi:aldehyde dehydrogenase (NAD+)